MFRFLAGIMDRKGEMNRRVMAPELEDDPDSA